MNTTRFLLGALAAAALAGCGAGASGPPTQTQVNVATSGSLQFAVGTANVAGTPGMNVVATFRQANGQSAFLVNTPTLTGPFSLAGATPQTVASLSGTSTTGATITLGPSTAETGAATAPANCPTIPCITGVPQQAAGNYAKSFPYVSSFGTSGGVFGSGFAPANYLSTGSPTSYTPYGVPLYATSLFTSWGGPPAYDPNGSGKGARDGTFSTSLLGVSEGLFILQGATAGAGAYTLSSNIPAANAAGATYSASFAGGAPVTLPTIAAPTVTIPGDGSVSTSYVLPAGVTGAYIQLVNRGSLDSAATDGAGNPLQLSHCGDVTGGLYTYYTFWVTAPAGTVTITNANAPIGKPGAACTAAQNSADSVTNVSTGDTFRVWVVGFDYNHYALTYNGPLASAYPQTPALPARADVSISARATVTSP